MAVHGKTLTVDVGTPDEAAVAVLKALASEWRLRILRILGTETRSVTQVAALLGIPPVTAAMHVKVLEEAELIVTKLVPASRGLQKVCSRTFDEVRVLLPSLEPAGGDAVEVSMPIGAYVEAEAVAPCGLATEDALVGILDDPASFFETERLAAQLLWFRQGFVEYRFPNHVPAGATPTRLQVRMEICSEARTHDEQCPSDITLWINGVEVATWTSPGDFGGTRGALTPDWWLDAGSQLGLQKRWEVTGAGASVDGIDVSGVTLENLHLEARRPITVRIGIRADARHQNGLNLFGRRFGNFPEDLVLRIAYAIGGR